MDSEQSNSPGVSDREEGPLQIEKDHIALISTKYDPGPRAGQGAQGTVFFAKTREVLPKKVSIKYLRFTGSCFPTIKKVLREVSILRQLARIEDNPHTVNLIDVILHPDIRSDGSPRFIEGGDVCIFLVFNYVEGKSLREVLDETFKKDISQRLKEQEVIKLLYHLCCALAFVHSANVVHRDLKPENIIVGPDFTARICDFGQARSLPQDSTFLKYKRSPVDVLDRFDRSTQLKSERNHRLSSTRDLSPHVVTREYRPPEIILLENNYNTAVDIWSLGCIMAEVFLCSERYALPASVQPSVLFPSISCNPLSPVRAKEEDELQQLKETDLMGVIFNVLGNQNEEDFSFITDPEHKQYASVLNQEGIQRVKFDLEFEEIGREVSSLMNRCLEFNPHFRASAIELARSPVFDRIRKMKMERESHLQIGLDIDRRGQYNYVQDFSLSLEASDLVVRLKNEAYAFRFMKEKEEAEKEEKQQAD